MTWIIPVSHGPLPNSQAVLDRQASHWPTPRSEDSESAGNHPGARDSLTGVMREWQTPGTDSFRSRGGERKDEMGLDQQARSLAWATPSAHDAKGANGPAHQEKERPHEGQLANQVAWGVSLPAPATAMPGLESSPPAPTSRLPNLDGMSSRVRSEVEVLFRHSTRARTVVLGGWRNKKQWRERGGPLTTAKSRAFTRPAFRRQLNPKFTEFLMGWTPGWTSLAPLASASPGTASFPSAPASPSAPSGDNWPTPDTQNARGGQAMRTEAKGKHAMSLHHVVEGWE